jgi:hypothetical protein
MTTSRVEPWILAIGDGPRVETIAAELRSSRYRTSVALTLSEVRDALGSGTVPTLVIVDTRAYAPWRADALERIAELVAAAAIRTIWLGDSPRTGAGTPHDQVLMVDAPVAAIVAASIAMHRRGHRAPSHPGVGVEPTGR